MRIAVLSNTTWYLHNFRLNLMLALQKSGYEVFAVGPEDDYVEKIQQAGIPHLPFNVSGDGTNPFTELNTLIRLRKTLKLKNIELVLSNTPKGNIYAGLAARSLGVPALPNVSGLGRTFIKTSPITLLVKLLYRFTFRPSRYVFFQNTDDRDLFLKNKLVLAKQPFLLPGSGVDLQRFTPSAHRQGLPTNSMTFILIARLLWDKGIGEYIKAARLVHNTFPAARFLLLGQMDVANPAAIPKQTVMNWQQEGVVEYLGETNDVVPYINDSDCVVLPSYREGTPRTLLEAASMAKPVITTDAVGCRNVVDDQVSGFLCELKNPEDLADKMLQLIKMKYPARLAMGKAGRQKMEKEFDESIVIQRYLDCVQCLESENNLKVVAS